MRTSFVRYVSPTPRHTSFRKERAIVGAARGRSASAIPDLELIHPGVSDLNRETPFGNSTRILSVVVAHLHCAEVVAQTKHVVPIHQYLQVVAEVDLTGDALSPSRAPTRRV
jgi:hypothetical protein